MDATSNSNRDKEIQPVGDFMCSAVESAGNRISVAMATIERERGGIDTAIDFVRRNPGKCAAIAIAVATLATGGAAVAAAGSIAAVAGGAGLLGAASTGTAISSLSGAALANASLAALGGGAIAAGGAGVAGGVAVITATGAVAGAAVSGGVVAATKNRS